MIFDWSELFLFGFVFFFFTLGPGFNERMIGCQLFTVYTSNMNTHTNVS